MRRGVTVGGDSLASIRNTQVKMSHYCGEGSVDNVTILMAPIRLQYSISRTVRMLVRPGRGKGEGRGDDG